MTRQAVSRWSLLWPFLATLVLPLAAAWFAYPQTHLPPGFGVFPPEFVQPAAPFNALVFAVVALLGLVVLLLLVCPTWFGFKPPAPLPPTPRPAGRWPWWFWLGGVCTGFFLWLMAARFTVFGDLVFYAFSPLWWGFILLLDGIVYRRTGGRSLLASRPRTLVISALVSVGGWFFFEYADYFALGNWYYPNGRMPGLTHSTIVVLFLIAYTTVWPVIFEWYTLLQTFPRFVARYAQGPRLALNGTLLLWAGLVLMVLMVFWPAPLFWVLWIGPMLVLTGQLIRLGVWTPFSALAEGNWSPMLVVALASLLNGFFWEVWNFISAQPPGLPPTNPNYWVYDIPYINVIHLWAEMPLLGFIGYLPFGALVWVFFIWAGKLVGFDASIDLPPAQPPEPR
jgi:hypothetical protein